MLQVLHDRLLAKVLSLPMSFFDTQPTGRLLNRFTKDVESTDVSLQSTFSSFTTCFVSVFMSTFVIAAVTRGAVFAALLPLLFGYRAIQRYYLATTRELKRLDSVALSPIFSNFGETLGGLATVRAFRRQDGFAQKNAALVDGSARVWWPIQVWETPCMHPCMRVAARVVAKPGAAKPMHACTLLLWPGRPPPAQDRRPVI